MKNFFKQIIDQTYHLLRSISGNPGEPISTSRLFSEVEFLNTLPKSQLKKLYALGHEVFLSPGEHLFIEGETPNEFYVVVDGILEVYRYDNKFHMEHRISLLNKGQPVGEMALIDNCPRSANVRAVSDSRLFCIPFSAITKLIQEGHNFDRVYQPLSKILAQRLRVSNEVIIQSLEKQVEEYKLRVIMGHFMIDVIAMMSLFIIFLVSLPYFTNLFTTASIITLLITSIFAGSLLILIRLSGLPLSSFGITLKNWRPAVRDAVIYTIPLMIISVIIKIVEVKLIPLYYDEGIFSPFTYLQTKALIHPLMSVKGTWLVSLLLYAFIGAPLQELVARGGLQGPLETFLTGKNKKWVAILLSNIMFSVIHVHYSLYIATLVFIPGLTFGWLYSKHKTLIAPIVSHMIIGIWAFWIVGLYIA